MRKYFLSIILSFTLCNCYSQRDEIRNSISTFIKRELKNPESFKLLNFYRIYDKGQSIGFNCSYSAKNSQHLLVNRSFNLEVDTISFHVRKQSEYSLDVENGSISGRILQNTNKKNYLQDFFIRLINIDTLNSSYTFEKKTGQSNKYSFENIPSGDYIICAMSQEMTYDMVPDPLESLIGPQGEFNKKIQLWRNIRSVSLYIDNLKKSYVIRNPDYLRRYNLKDPVVNKDFYKDAWRFVVNLPADLRNDIFLDPSLEKIVTINFITIRPNREIIKDLTFSF